MISVYLFVIRSRACYNTIYSDGRQNIQDQCIQYIKYNFEQCIDPPCLVKRSGQGGGFVSCSPKYIIKKADRIVRGSADISRRPPHLQQARPLQLASRYWPQRQRRPLLQLDVDQRPAVGLYWPQLPWELGHFRDCIIVRCRGDSNSMQQPVYNCLCLNNRLTQVFF